MSRLRRLVRDPAYFLLSTTTLALAVGANLVVFTFVNALWLKQPPIVDPGRVVVLLASNFDVPDGSRYSEVALDSFRRVGVFQEIAGQAVTSGDFEGHAPRVTLAEEGRAVEALWVTPEYFSVLGLKVAGREFRRGNGEQAGAAPVIISDHVWRTMFGGRADVIGLRLRSTPVPLDIVGVAPQGFHGARRGERADVWLPHHLLPRVVGINLANLRFAVMPMIAIARLSPGVTAAQARATYVAQTGRTSMDMMPLADVFGAADVPMVRVHGGDLMTVAFATAIFVLIGGCAMLVALALVHCERRGREVAVRAALGASPARLVGHLARELAGLAAVGAIATIFVTKWVVGMLPVATLPGGIDLTRLDLSVDWRVVLGSVSGCVLVLVGAGAVPAIRYTRARIATSLVSSATTSPRSSVRFRKTVLGVHVAATTVVLVAAALFVESVTTAFAIGPGFDAAHVMFATVRTRYAQAALDEQSTEVRNAKDTAAAMRLIDRLGALPGIEIVALGESPLGAESEFRVTRPRILAVDGGEVDTPFGWFPVSDKYLEALGVPLLAGRAGAPGEVVVTSALAEDLWTGESPLGKRVAFGATPATVVGIADPAFGSVRLGRPRGMLYFGDTSVASMIRATGVLTLAIRADQPASLVAAVEKQIDDSFPDAPVIQVTTGDRLLATDLGRERMTAWMFSGFGLVGLLLALVSVFGLVAHLVESRWREFAVRMALGASRRNVAGLALWATLEPALIGSACGVIVALGLSRTIESYLYGLTAMDLPTYAGVFILVIGRATVAGAVACHRLRRVSLMDSLKVE